MHQERLIWPSAFILALLIHSLLIINIQAPKSGAKNYGENGINASIIQMKNIFQNKNEKQNTNKKDQNIIEKNSNTIEKIKPPKESKKSITKKPVLAKIKPIISTQKKPRGVSKNENTKKNNASLAEIKTQSDNNINSNNDVKNIAKQTQNTSNPVVGNSNNSSSGGSNSTAKASYISQLKHILETKKRYPERAKKRRQEGTVHLWFKLNNDGTLQSYEIKKSSGHRLLDKEVEELINRVTPFPKFSNEMKIATISITVPMSFKIK